MLLVGGNFNQQVRTGFDHRFANGFTAFCLRAGFSIWEHLADINAVSLDRSPGIDSAVSEYEDAMVLALNMRRIFVSASGLVGIGSMAVAQNDRLCALHGGKVPYILRPEREHYLFLQSCFVADIMYGEFHAATEEIFEIH
jgi:hypothetical protein